MNGILLELTKMWKNLFYTPIIRVVTSGKQERNYFNFSIHVSLVLPFRVVLTLNDICVHVEKLYTLELRLLKLIM